MASRNRRRVAGLFLFYACCAAVHAHRDWAESGGSLAVAGRAEQPKATTPPSAFDQFVILENAPQSDGSLKPTTLFAHGKFCPDKAATDPKGSCLLPDVHDDRTWFQFRYAARSNESAIAEPVVTVLKRNSSVIRPKLKEFRLDKEAGTGTFTVHYDCKRSGTSRLRLEMQVTKTKSISMTWKKICGSGVNGFVSLTPIGLSDSGNMKPPLESGPTQESTAVELGVKFPQTFIDFKKPYLTSSNKDVVVSLRGHVQSGSVITGKAKSFKIFYDCKAKTKAEITLTVAIPPWNNATLGWTKNCGGTAPSGLVVRSGNEAVFNQSGVASPFQVAETTSLDAARSANVFKLNAQQSLINFVIENVGKSNFEVQGVGLTVSAPNVLAVFAENANGIIFSQERLMENKPLTIPSKRSTTLSLRCICLARGAAVVLVTLPIHGYKRVEFGFYKDCERPQIYHHSGMFTTASGLLFIVCIFLVVGGVFGYRHYRNRTRGTAKYTLVRAVTG